MLNKRFVRSSFVLLSVAALAACGSSSKSNSGGGGGGSTAAATGGTITVGFMSDQTGAASSGFQTDPQGYKAVIDKVNKAGGVNGQQINVVLADTTSTPTGALTAAQKLVQQDHVTYIMEDSSVFYGAEPYLLKQGIPVVGSAIDGPIWGDKSNTNLVGAIGVIDESNVQLSEGTAMKAQGVKSCGAISYTGSQSATEAAEGFNQACTSAGLKAGYLNTQIPFGSTDVGAVALKIKESGIDGLFTATEPSTAFALIAALHQLGVNLTASVVETGYGGDLLQSAAGVAAGQGIEFATIGEPAEMNTAATQARAADLAAEGVTGPPTFAEQYAYLVATAFTTILKAAPAHASGAQFLTASKSIADYDANGLLAPEKISFGSVAPTQCTWLAKLTGKAFVVVAGTPFCAGTEPLKTS